MLQKSQNRRKYPCDSFREVGSHTYISIYIYKIISLCTPAHALMSSSQSHLIIPGFHDDTSKKCFSACSFRSSAPGRKGWPDTPLTLRRRNVAAQVVEELKTVTYATPPMEERRKTTKKPLTLTIQLPDIYFLYIISLSLSLSLSIYIYIYLYVWNVA